MLHLPELIEIISTKWPERLNFRAITHLHLENVTLQDGALVRIRVLIQTVKPAPFEEKR